MPHLECHSLFKYFTACSLNLYLPQAICKPQSSSSPPAPPRRSQTTDEVSSCLYGRVVGHIILVVAVWQWLVDSWLTMTPFHSCFGCANLLDFFCFSLFSLSPIFVIVFVPHMSLVLLLSWNFVPHGYHGAYISLFSLCIFFIGAKNTDLELHFANLGNWSWVGLGFSNL